MARLSHAASVAGLLAMLCATGAGAVEIGYYRVVGVAAGDVLNIRADPSASSGIVGALAPGARPVEVLEVAPSGDGAWGRVLVEDANGWVSMRFLESFEPGGLLATEVPDGLRCSGTEPFWGLDLGDGQAHFSATDIDEQSLPLTTGTPAVGRNHRFTFIAGSGPRRLTVVLGRNEACSDGMSDRDFGWRIDLVTEGIGKSPVAAYEGCCTVPVAR